MREMVELDAASVLSIPETEKSEVVAADLCPTSCSATSAMYLEPPHWPRHGKLTPAHVKKGKEGD